MSARDVLRGLMRRPPDVVVALIDTFPQQLRQPLREHSAQAPRDGRGDRLQLGDLSVGQRDQHWITFKAYAGSALPLVGLRQQFVHALDHRTQTPYYPKVALAESRRR